MSRVGLSVPVFGASLSGHSLTAVKQMCHYLTKASVLSTEGLFRLSADTEAVDQWVSRLDADPRADLSGITDANVVASLLKRFLRLLNPPLLTYNLYEALIEAAKSEPEEVMLDKLCSCIIKLPPLNVDILTAVLQLLLLVLEHQDKNRMGIDNLTTVFAPCLIWQNPNDVMRMADESNVVAQIIRYAEKIVHLERVGVAPRDTGDTSSVFVGVRLLSQPAFSSSPVMSRRSPMTQSSASRGGDEGSSNSATKKVLAYVKFDYKGSMAAETLTLTRGEAVTIVELPEKGSRWCRCVSRDSSAEGWVPVSFLDCPLLQRNALGRERALERAGSSAGALPTDSPLRNSDLRASLPNDLKKVLFQSSRSVSVDGPVRSIEEMAERMEMLSRALIKEKEERLQLEKRVEMLLAAKSNE